MAQSRLLAAFYRKVQFIVCGLFLIAEMPARGASLEARINALLGDAQLKTATVGVQIVEITAKGPVVVYDHNGSVALPPASCTKLLTTGAAFEKYGPKGAFNTQLFKVGDDLLILGAGDPAFCDAKLLGPNQAVTTVFDGWAAKAQKAGVTGYRDLIVDDRIFDQEFTNPEWPADQTLDYYEAPIGGLNFNANCLDWLAQITPAGIRAVPIPDTSYVTIVNKAKRGEKTAISLIRPRNSNAFELRGTLAASLTKPESVTIVDPGLFAGTILSERLAGAGIKGVRQVRRPGARETFASAQLLAAAQTPVLSVIHRANTNSLNMMAEGLCKRLGHDATGQPGSWENGTAAVVGYLASLHVGTSGIILHDGSGLSAQDRVPAAAFTAVLAHVAGRSDGQQFLETLAAPAEDGTLERRFNTAAMKPLADAVRAKTGHIKGVSCLSGVLEAGGRRFAFSILCNKYVGNVNPWQEQVCKALYDWANNR